MIGKRIRARRKELRISQATLSKQLGVSNAAISQWERGETEPRGQNLITLCNILGCSPEYLLQGKNSDALISVEALSSTLTNREKIFLQLFRELPDIEADELLKNLEDKKRYFDAVMTDLLKKRRKIAS